jgi:site-specific DNA recombinase
MSLTRSLIPQQHRPILDQLLVRLSLRQGQLFDDAGHRMIPTHATKAGIRYRYYASTPVLHGEAKTASAGSISRVPAAEIEDTLLKSLEAHLATKQDGSTSGAVQLRDREALAQLVAGIVVHRDKLVVRFKPDQTDEEPDRTDDHSSLTIVWRKPPSKRSRRILLPHNASRSDVQPEQFERRARLVSAIAKGRRWLDDVVTWSSKKCHRALHAREVQRSAGQYDDLARLPRSQSCQSRRRRSPAPWYRR